MNKNTLAQATPTAITGLVQQARAEATQQFPDDPKIADQAEAAVRQRFNLVKQDFTLAKQEAVYTARDAIFAKTDQDPQARPDRWDELMQNPTFKAQIDTLNGQPNGAQEVAKLQGLVNRNVLNVPPSPQRDERFQELKGMANDNPQGFRNVDLSQEDLTRLQMSELHGQQRKMNDASRADPNLARVKQVLDNDKFFQKIGMLKGTDKEPNQDYIKFMGALNAQAAVWQARGKPPTDQEVKDFAAMLVTPSSQAWGAKPFYQQPVPPDMRDTIVQRFKERKQATPTEGEISRIYNDLFYNRATRNRPAINEELARRAGRG